MAARAQPFAPLDVCSASGSPAAMAFMRRSSSPGLSWGNERRGSGTNPLIRLRRQLFPFLSPVGDIFPRPGEVFPLRESPWQNRQVSSSPVNGRRSQPLSCKLYAPAKASPFRERWHGRAVTERVASRTNPLSRLRRQLPREGEPLAKRVSFVLTGQRQEEACR